MPEGGVEGITSVNKDHRHNVVPMTTIDPMTGEQRFEGLYAASENNHTHGIEDYTHKSLSLESETDEECITRVMDNYDEACKYEEDSIAEGQLAEAMYCGDQWDSATLNDLTEKRRAALTINLTESRLDNLFGYQRANRTEFEFLPMEGGDQRICDILKYRVKAMMEQCFYSREESKVFEDCAIAGRGVFHIYDDYDTNISGEAIIEKFNWSECFFAPHEKEDLSDCDYQIKEKWFTKAKMEGIWGKDKVKDLYPESPSTSGISSRHISKLHSTAFINVESKKYKVLECLQKIYRKVPVFAHTSGDVINGDRWYESDIKSVKTIPGFSVIYRTAFTIKKSTICSVKVLDNTYIEDDYFSLLPVYAKRRKGVFWGKVKGVISLQKLINKTYSQFIDIIAKVANYGYYVDDNTFPSKKEEADFKQNASSPGAVHKVLDINHVPVKEEGVKFPSEIVNAIAMFNQNMREYLNINLEFQGIDSDAQSGVAIQKLVQQQLLGNGYIFDNLSFAKKALGRIIIKKIQKLDSTEKILRIIENQALKGTEIKIGNEIINPNNPIQYELQKQTIVNLLQEADLSKFDVIVSESAQSPSVLMGNYMLLVEMAKSGIPMNPATIIPFAPLPENTKNQIMKSLNEQQQIEAEKEKAKYDTEIQKTLIAAQAKTQEQ